MNHLVIAVTRLSSQLPSFRSRVLAYRETIPGNYCGSYVSLSGESTEHIIGLLSNPLGWESLTRSLERDMPRAGPRGLVDGACEINKIVAEAMRDRLPDPSAWAVGLPLFADGMVSGGRHIELQAADIALGGSLAMLVLLTRPALDAGISSPADRTS